MNKTKVMVFGLFIMLLVMHISYATAENDQNNNNASSVSSDQTQSVTEQVSSGQAVSTGETQTAKDASSEKKEETVKLLADTHKAGGVACSDCHKETPPAKEVPTEVCLTCHEDYKDVALSSVDPHNAHVEFTSCGDCHHSHKQSENQCMSCHTFELQTP